MISITVTMYTTLWVIFSIGFLTMLFEIVYEMSNGPVKGLNILSFFIRGMTYFVFVCVLMSIKS